MTVRTVHELWAWVVVVGNGLAGLWALGAHRFEALRRRALWWFTGVVEVAVSIQVTLGAFMVGAQGIAAPPFHVFYGFVALMSVGIIYSYRHQVVAYRYLLYGLGGLFLMGLGIRAMFLAHPV